MPEPSSVSVPADDRGLAYGDGLFETMAVAGGQVRLLELHLDRLCTDAQRLFIATNRQALRSAIVGRARTLGNGVLKLLLTRGSGPRGYAIPTCATPRVLFLETPRAAGFADAWCVAPASPLAVRICQTPLSINPALAGMKHLNRLPQVLARSEWTDDGITEGLMRAAGDAILCATAANVFALSGETLVTPTLDQAGVAGVMRRALLEVARAQGMRVIYEDLTLDLLRHRADAVLLSSSLTGLRAVGSIDGDALEQTEPEVSTRIERLRLALGRRVGVPDL